MKKVMSDDNNNNDNSKRSWRYKDKVVVNDS